MAIADDPSMHSGLVSSPASELWADINQEGDACLDQGLPGEEGSGFSCWPAELQFNMTGQTGSYLFMAPEMFLGCPYNEKVREDAGGGGVKWVCQLLTCIDHLGDTS